MPGKPAVFLDRDGVIIEDVHYLRDVSQVHLLPGVPQAIARLKAAGFLVVVVTNQAGVARGFFPEDRISQVHAHLQNLLHVLGQARVDRFYHCPHHPEGAVERYRTRCGCRKPEPGMLLQAAQDLDLDLAQSWLVGDKVSDLEAGARAGCRTFLVRDRRPREALPQGEDVSRLRLEGIVGDLAEATSLILNRAGGTARGQAA